ncbi:flagellar biosynthetic protein FlhB [Clostridium acetireducens DSM 10703]|uniref:Flagellar biosynthetic protein FliR n=1 Tax=Clostridium acetireducens DSM 10703 TaxID=1121290 RepID=A0A1E8F0Z1_9CLOT|nr:fused FliR family export protein/FlhB family type III secretion system protein [Clostridium acetireducens]OFI06820.1 flagellar biosynthetic protein FlhB [Clostridium acetireducens DSM 10703]
MIDAVYFTALILVFLRLFAFFITIPVFFPKETPVYFKVGFALIMSYILLPGINYATVSNITDMFPFILNCINEIITGLTLGYITNLCFISVRIAGNMMDLQVGFAMMSMFDPNTNSNATLLERLLYWFSIIIFLLIDGHHMLIRALIESFNTINIGQYILGKPTATLIIKAFIEFFSISLKIAIPIVLIILITDLTLGLIARTVPQLNVMILGLPIKILVGLTAFSLALPIFIKVVESSFQSLPDVIKQFYKTIPLLLAFSSDDKTEEATPHKLSEAKKKGQVAKSKEVGLAFTLLASTIVLLTLGQYIINNLGRNLIVFMQDYINISLNYESAKKIGIIAVVRIAMTILPVAIPIMFMGILANFLQTGFILTKEPLKPDLKKLNPISGLKKMFSVRTVVELFKDLAIVSVVGFVGYKFIKKNYLYILTFGHLKPITIVEESLKLAVNIFFKITLVMIAIALLDFIFQKRQFKKDMKMTKQEIKEEFKQQEGDPLIKGKIRQKQREMAARRMMQQVPDATVVVTNPTHLAIALKYEKGDNAPKVVAKGADYLALKIKKVAKHNEVPIIENRHLARLLYEQVELEEEIPAEMYEAVAEILALVYSF